jgi:ATP-dependent Clp protease adaptor protein ClpS
MALSDVKVEKKTVTTLKPPKKWKVVFLNDDVTPMELVIELLTNVFRHSENSAKEITLEIHNTGSGIAGVYTYEIAEQKGVEATTIARNNGFPLKIQVEEEN